MGCNITPVLVMSNDTASQESRSHRLSHFPPWLRWRGVPHLPGDQTGDPPIFPGGETREGPPSGGSLFSLRPELTYQGVIEVSTNRRMRSGLWTTPPKSWRPK